MSVAGDAARLAVGTLTVLPVRPPRAVGERVAGLAMVLAPLAAVPLAVAAGLVVWLGDAVLAPSLLTAVLAVAVLALGSRGLHLDGLADTADGLAVPGDDARRRLDVMRTGDVGPVGAVTLLLVVVTQATALAGVVDARGDTEAAMTVALAVVVSRGLLAPACARGISAARADGLGSAVAGTVPAQVAALVVALLAVAAFLVDGGPGLAGVLVAAGAGGVVLLRARRRLGGVTGDVLGAVVEVGLAAYLVVQVVDLPTG